MCVYISCTTFTIRYPDRIRQNLNTRQHQTNDIWEAYPMAVWTHIFWFQLLVSTTQYCSLQLLQVCSQVLLIFQSQFLVDNLQVSDRIHLTLNVCHIVVLERSWKQEESTALYILYYITLYYVIWYIILYYIILYIIYYITLYILLYYVILYIILYYIILYKIILHYITLHYIIYYIMLYYAILYITLHYIILYKHMITPSTIVN